MEKKNKKIQANLKQSNKETYNQRHYLDNQPKCKA